MANVLRSFLVSIGYKVDSSSEKNFIGSISGATLQARLLGDVIEEVTRKVVTSITRMAAGFEDLYYASQRTNTSAQNIKALGYAVSQLGGSYEGAVGSLEEFARKMRDNPGYESMVKQLGVQTRVNGKLREGTEILTDLGKVFRSQNYSVARQYAEALGIDENTFRILRDQPEALAKYREEFVRTAQQMGLNLTLSSERSKELNQSLRSFWLTVTVTAQKILSDLTPALTAFIDKIREWLAANPEALNNIVIALGAALERLGKAFVEALEALAPFLTEWAKAGGDMAKEGSLLDTLNKTISGIRTLVEWISTLITWVQKLNDMPFWPSGLAGVNTAMKAYNWATGGGGGAGEGAGGAGGGDTPGKPTIMGDLKKGWGKVKSWFGGGGGGKSGGGIPGVPDVDNMTATEKNTLGLILQHESHGKNTMNYVGQGQGLDPTTPKGYTAQGYFQILNSNWNRLAPKLGIKVPNAMAGSLEEQTKVALALLRESGVGNWANFNPALKAALARGDKSTAGMDAMVPNLGTKEPPSAGNTNFPPVRNRSDLAAAAGTADVMHPLGWDKRKGGMGYADITGAKADFGRMPAVDPSQLAPNNDNSRSVTVQQTNRTEVNVTGSTDPSAVGSAVAGQQERINALSLRNAQGAIR